MRVGSIQSNYKHLTANKQPNFKANFQLTQRAGDMICHNMASVGLNRNMAVASVNNLVNKLSRILKSEKPKDANVILDIVPDNITNGRLMVPTHSKGLPGYITKEVGPLMSGPNFEHELSFYSRKLLEQLESL